MINWPLWSCFFYRKTAISLWLAFVLALCLAPRQAAAFELAAVAPAWGAHASFAPQSISGKTPTRAEMPGSWSIFHQDAQSTVSIYYPQMDNILIDNKLSQWADLRLRTFVAGVAALGEGKSRYSMRVDYSLSRTSPRFASVVFRISIETGGARPDAGLSTFTYDLAEGRELEYEDIFSEYQDFLNFISDYSQAELLRKLGTAGRELIMRGTAPSKENFEYFAIRQDGLELFFPPDQVAASALGEQQLVIPLEKLKPFGPDMKIWAREPQVKSKKSNGR